MKKVLNITRSHGSLQLRNALGQFTEKLEEGAAVRVQNVSKEYVGELYTRVIQYSPVDTGAFRRSIKISRGRPFVGPYPKSNMKGKPAPEQGKGPTPEEKEVSGYKALFSRSAKNRLGGLKQLRKRSYYITATVIDKDGYPYSENIEYTGWRIRGEMKPPVMPFKKAITSVKGLVRRLSK